MILNFRKMLHCFPNVCIAYKRILIIIVTVQSLEMNFSKFKFLKS